MQKYLIILMFMLTPLTVNAQGNGQGQGNMQGTGDQQRIQDPQTHEDTVPPTTPRGMNNNKTTISNVDINQVVTNVGQRVRNLAQDPDRTGGIGEQVRTLAQEQVKVQEKIQQHLGNLEQRGNIFKFVFGQKKEDLDQLGQYVNQNKQRIDQMKDLKEQLLDSDDQAEIDQTITDLVSQNEVLQEKINSEQYSGIVGWFKRMLGRN